MLIYMIYVTFKVQTLFRLAWTIFGYYAYSCSVELTTEIFVFVYLTYFYSKFKIYQLFINYTINFLV